MEPLRICGIPVTRPGYYMNCMLTNAQIDLIAADVSVVDYGHADKKKEPKKKRSRAEFDDSPADAASVRKAGEEWLERYGSDKTAGKGLSIGDILKGGMKADVGVKLED